MGTGLAAGLLWLAAASGQANTGVPARSPCDQVRPAELDLSLRAEPPNPAVGDVVELEVQITNSTAELAAIPLFRLLGAEPLFAVEAQESSYPFVEFARYRMRAAQPGQAALQLSVNFETSFGCIGLPIFVFHSASSPPYLITVRGDVATASATPTPTPTPRGAAATALASPTRNLPPARDLGDHGGDGSSRRAPNLPATLVRTSATSPRR